jgi:hypothetical protein
MIVTIIDTTPDAHLLHATYAGIDDALVLINPKSEELDKVLRERPEPLIGLGHGCSSGLFGCDCDIIIGERNLDLLKDRDLICIWCNADGFLKKHPELTGFASSMFISNESELYYCGFSNYTNEDIFSEVSLFSERVNKLIQDDVPLKDWPSLLRSQADMSKDYVAYNYKGFYYQP